jgi:hypothetical protein
MPYNCYNILPLWGRSLAKRDGGGTPGEAITEVVFYSIVP